MTETYLESVLAKFRTIRERKGISRESIEEKLILGPGWVRRFERGETIPSLDMLFALLHVINASLAELLDELNIGEAPTEIERFLYAVPQGGDLNVHFRYAKFDAVHPLPKATSDQFETVIKVLRDGLAGLPTANAANSEALKTEAVAEAFLKAVQLWPHANPSDLWWFIVYRAYCDPFNHRETYVWIAWLSVLIYRADSFF